jgi:pentatricopeptide repeat protein
MIVHGVKPTIYTYTYLLHGFTRVGNLHSALDVYDRLLFMGLQPDIVVLTILIRAFLKNGDLRGALRFYETLKTEYAGLEPDTVLYNVLINGLGKEGDLGGMKSKFEEMVRGGIRPDAVTLNSLMDAHIKAGDTREALNWMYSLTKIRKGRPTGENELKSEHQNPLDADGVGSTTSSAQADVKWNEVMTQLEESTTTSDQQRTSASTINIEPDIHVYNTLIHGLASNQDMAAATSWFSDLASSSSSSSTVTNTTPSSPQLPRPNVHIYTSIIHAFANKQPEPDMPSAQRWFQNMLQSGIKPDQAAFHTLIAGYCKVQDMQSAQTILEEMKGQGFQPDEMTFSLIVDAHLKAGRILAALSVYREMMESVSASKKKEKSSRGLGIAVVTGVSPSLHMYAALITKLGHEVGKVDSAGLAVPVRRDDSGGLSRVERTQLKSSAAPASSESQPSSEPPIDDLISADTSNLSEPNPNIQRHGLSPYHHSILLKNIPRSILLKLEEYTSCPFYLPHSKAKYHPDLMFLYASYRASIPRLPRPLLIDIYDAVMAHHSHLNSIKSAKWVYKHALEDGCLPDESITVRIFKLVSRLKGWDGVLMASSDFRNSLSKAVMFGRGWRSRAVENMMKKKDVTNEFDGEKITINEPEKNLEGVHSDRGQLASVVEDNDSDSLMDNAAQQRFSRSLLPISGSIGDSNTTMATMPFNSEAVSELEKLLNRVVLASYPMAMFRKDFRHAISMLEGNKLEQNRSNPSNDLSNFGSPDAAATDDAAAAQEAHMRQLLEECKFLKYDETARKHFVYGQLNTEEGTLEFWDTIWKMQLEFRRLSQKIPRLNSKKGTTTTTTANANAISDPTYSKNESEDSEKFLKFCYIYLRHCEVNWFWDARRHALDQLKSLGWNVQERHYLKWVLDHEAGYIY